HNTHPATLRTHLQNKHSVHAGPASPAHLVPHGHDVPSHLGLQPETQQRQIGKHKLCSFSFVGKLSLGQPDRPASTNSFECHATATPRPYEPKTKFTSIVVMTSTGSPLSRVGL